MTSMTESCLTKGNILGNNYASLVLLLKYLRCMIRKERLMVNEPREGRKQSLYLKGRAVTERIHESKSEQNEQRCKE